METHPSKGAPAAPQTETRALNAPLISAPTRAALANPSAPSASSFPALRAADLLRHAESLHERLFLVTDRNLRIMSLSLENARRLGRRSIAELTGQPLSDFLPPLAIEKFRCRDRAIADRNQASTNTLEPWINARGRLDLALTDHFPLRDQRARHMGVMRVFHRYPSRATQRPEADAHPVERAVAYIRERIGERLTLSELSQHMKTSDRRLQRLFKSHFNTGVKQYIIETRVDFAIEELARTMTPIKQIAHALGFRDPSAFAHHFRKATGLGPKEFRKRNAVQLGEPPPSRR